MTEPRDELEAPTVSGFGTEGEGDGSGAGGPAPQIEGYQITGRLGQGGMGTVWRAVQAGTQREVALKDMSAGAFASETARLRFEREVELAARLEHPNIARVYDSRVHRGVYYYAMELIDGVHLDEYVRRHHLSQREVLGLMATIGRAVQHAHQRGVIHRDLKPSNILVTEDGQPHVLDFGLAKAFREEVAGATVSAAGEAAGTPAYMSPEQAAGRLEELDTRSDVYSLGVILYQLLTGKHPHDLSGTRYEVIRRVAEEDIRRPREAAKAVDRELEALLVKALARDPAARYASAGELAADIDNYLAGEPLTARRPTTVYFLGKRIRKYRLPVAVAAAVLAALIGMAVWSYVNVRGERDRATVAEKKMAREVERARIAELLASLRQKQVEAARSEVAQEAERARAAEQVALAGQKQTETAKEEADQEAAKAKAVTDVLTGMLSTPHPQSTQGRQITFRQMLDNWAADIERRSSTQPELQASLRTTIGFVYQAQGRYEQAKLHHEEALRLYESVHGKEHRESIGALARVANALRSQRHYPKAEVLQREALRRAQNTAGQEDHLTLILTHYVANTLYDQGRHAHAEKLCTRALDGWEKMQGASDWINVHCLGAGRSAMEKQLPTPGYAFELQATDRPVSTPMGTFLVGWVRVVSPDCGSPVQTIPVEMNDPYACWMSYGLEGQDVDFDGYTDIAVRQREGAKWGRLHWWLYDPETKRFHTNALTRELSNLTCNDFRVDPEAKEIRITRFHGAELSEHTYRIVDGRIRLIASRKLNGSD